MINSVKRKHPPRDHAGQWQAGTKRSARRTASRYTHRRAQTYTHTREARMHKQRQMSWFGRMTTGQRADLGAGVSACRRNGEIVCSACVRASAHGLLVVGWARAHTHILIWCIGMCAGTHIRKMHGEQQQQNTRTRHRRNMILDV